MLYSVLIFFSIGIVALDQITKYFTTQHYQEQFSLALQLYPGIYKTGHPGLACEPIPFWDGVVRFTFTANEGMAWSMFAGGRWFFVVATVVALVFIILAFKKKWVDHPIGCWALAAIAGGAVGNLIDRIRYGFVVDMIDVEFIDFPVFNVADCFIVCGAIALLIYVFFFDKKKEKTNEADRRQSE